MNTRLNQYRIYENVDRPAEGKAYLQFAVENLQFLGKFSQDTRPYVSMLAYSFQNPEQLFAPAWWSASLQVHKALSLNSDLQIATAAKVEAAKVAQILVDQQRMQKNSLENQKAVNQILR